MERVTMVVNGVLCAVTLFAAGVNTGLREFEAAMMFFALALANLTCVVMFSSRGGR